MALQDFGRLFALVDSNLQVYVESISIQTDSGNIEINTFDGLAGFSPGPGAITISLNYAVPAAGFETNFQAMVVDKQIHAMQIGIGPNALITEGKFNTDTISGSVTTATQGAVTFKGKLAKFEAAL
jgi:hypothetical protein